MILRYEDDSGRIGGKEIVEWAGYPDNKLKVKYTSGKEEYLDAKMGEQWQIWEADRLMFELVGAIWNAMDEEGRQIYYEATFEKKAQYRKGGKFFHTKDYTEWKLKCEEKTNPTPKASKPNSGGKSAGTK